MVCVKICLVMYISFTWNMNSSLLRHGPLLVCTTLNEAQKEKKVAKTDNELHQETNTAMGPPPLG